MDILFQSESEDSDIEDVKSSDSENENEDEKNDSENEEYSSEFDSDQDEVEPDEEGDDDAIKNDDYSIEMYIYDNKPVKTNHSKGRKKKNISISKQIKKCCIEKEYKFLDRNVRNRTLLFLKKQKLDESVEELIFDTCVRLYENKYNTKVKKSTFVGRDFKEIYTDNSYNILFKLVNSEDKDSVISMLKNNTFIENQYREQKFIDSCETKAIEEPPRVKPGIHRCNKCFYNKDKKDDDTRGQRTWYYELQTRSADEPMTCFITCLDCGFKWKQ